MVTKVVAGGAAEEGSDSRRIRLNAQEVRSKEVVDAGSRLAHSHASGSSKAAAVGVGRDRCA